jgi:hypothetical protein
LILLYQIQTIVIRKYTNNLNIFNIILTFKRKDYFCISYWKGLLKCLADRNTVDLEDREVVLAEVWEEGLALHRQRLRWGWDLEDGGEGVGVGTEAVFREDVAALHFSYH